MSCTLNVSIDVLSTMLFAYPDRLIWSKKKNLITFSKQALSNKQSVHNTGEYNFCWPCLTQFWATDSKNAVHFLSSILAFLQ